MNPGLVVKLRPSGPWRIGPDSGARNRVDLIYHSDSLYSAVTAAMARLGWLEEWLDATARNGSPAVSLSSCFPYLDDMVFVVPPRTVWPPASPSAKAARVRWKSARFVPLPVVQVILAGLALDENQWSVDGASDCLVPAGSPGPFRTAVRWSAGVDRLNGNCERHSTACIEFRAGSGLWMVVSFADEAAQARWSDRVKAAFRLLADTGFGGERSRGWGRSEAPEFTDGVLPDLILPVRGVETVEAVEAAVVSKPAVLPLVVEVVEAAVEPESPGAPVGEALAAAESEGLAPLAAEPAAAEPGSLEAPVGEALAAAESEGLAPLAAEPVATSEPEAPAEEAAPPAEPVEAVVVEPAPAPVPSTRTHPHWLLSLFTPAPDDTVDWRRGNYTVLTRGGRVDSPAGSGELKKPIPMVAEGSVVYAEAAPRGSAADVAPDGFAHPVFRAGFALTIPLPEVR
jgi:CRISPR type III-A-associated RAMP protein Csm4